MRRLDLISGLAVLAALGASGTAIAMEKIPLLDSLQRGQWELRERGTDKAKPRRICLGEPAKLVQLRHAEADCKQFVARSDARAVTVTYSCKGGGQGTTTIRRESDKLVKISTQGIDRGAPFSFVLEGRRIGRC